MGFAFTERRSTKSHEKPQDSKAVKTDELHDHSIFPKTRSLLTPPSGKILKRTCETAPVSITSSKRWRVCACNFVRASTGFQTKSGSCKVSSGRSTALQLSSEQLSGKFPLK